MGDPENTDDDKGGAWHAESKTMSALLPDFGSLKHPFWRCGTCVRYQNAYVAKSALKIRIIGL